MTENSPKWSFLQISPKVWADKNHLFARTSKIYQFLNLFSYSRTVVADRIKKHIEIKIRMFWFFTTKRYIPFDDIKHIDIDRLEKVDDINFSTFIAGDETWYVRVIRKSTPYPESLFRFKGGVRDNHIYERSLFINLDGLQYEKAMHYAELVSKYTESRLWIDIEKEYNINVDHYKCLNCGHISPSEIKCMYCGSPEMEKLS